MNYSMTTLNLHQSQLELNNTCKYDPLLSYLPIHFMYDYSTKKERELGVINLITPNRMLADVRIDYTSSLIKRGFVTESIRYHFQL